MSKTPKTMLQGTPVKAKSAAQSVAQSSVHQQGTNSDDDVERKPWKYFGYRGFSRFLSSDDDFFFLRKFGRLHCRVLLAVQDQLVRLERQLETVDREGMEMQPDRHNGSFQEDTASFQKRTALIGQIHAKLKEYNELVLQHAEIRSRPKVSRRNIESVENWLSNHGNAIAQAETLYLDDHDDLFPLAPRPISYLRRLLERSKRFQRSSLWRTVPADNDPLSGIDEHVHYRSDIRIDQFITVLVLLLGMIMLVTPLWILKFVGHAVDRLGVITAFAVLFVGMVSFTTAARPSETIAATAAYLAVLIVFLPAAGG